MAKILNKMPKFNLEYLNELRRKVKSEEDRAYIIGLAIHVGSYIAREALSPEGYFGSGRDVTSKIQEAIHIAEEQESVLRLLSESSPEEVIESLEKTIETLPTDNKIPESELSRCIEFSRKPLGREYHKIIGKRIERRMMKIGQLSYEDYRKNPSERELNRIFLREEETIRHAIVYELKN